MACGCKKKTVATPPVQSPVQKANEAQKQQDKLISEIIEKVKSLNK